jgi:hypothetical protein
MDAAGVTLTMRIKTADVHAVTLENRLQKRRNNLPARLPDAR